jgi:hypothetical protein
MTKKTKSLLAALKKHDRFLAKMGLSPKTKSKNPPSNLPEFLHDNVAEQYQQNLSNKIEGNQSAGSQKGILSDVINYTEADRAVVKDLAKQVSIEYNKGSLQFISKETDLTKLGKKV